MLVVWSCVAGWVIVVLVIGVVDRVGCLSLLLTYEVTFHSVPFRAVFRRSEPGRNAEKHLSWANSLQGEARTRLQIDPLADLLHSTEEAQTKTLKQWKAVIVSPNIRFMLGLHFTNCPR